MAKRLPISINICYYDNTNIKNFRLLNWRVHCVQIGFRGLVCSLRTIIQLIVTNQIKTLQENLAKDLVSLEENELVTEQQLDKITDTYTQVYDIISKVIDKTKE